MNTVKDHPDIEKLPLEVDGKPVRELVREVFRNTENGTPDDITQAGCIALALKGKEAWNAWQRGESADSERYDINFSNLDFRKSPQRKINFSGFHFGDFANFSGSQFGDLVRFVDAEFGEQANFTGAQFGGYVNFSNARFGNDPSFFGTQFAGFADFSGTKFSGFTDFRAQPMDTLGWVYGSKFSDAKAYARQLCVTPSIFNVISFAGAQFKGEADFSDREFLDRTDFGVNNFIQMMSVKEIELNNIQEVAVSFGVPPKFHGCKLHQNTTFEGAKFPKATGSESAARAYRTLKLAFSQQQAIREEQRFFRLEMAEEATAATGIQSHLYWAYKTFSDFGFSVTQPLKYAAYALLVFVCIYGALSWFGQCVLAKHACRFNPAWIEFSLLQAIPLPGLDKVSDTLRPLVFSSNEYLSVVLTLFVIAHKIISLAALFLAGLALRNLFKLK